jgi:chromate transporter
MPSLVGVLREWGRIGCIGFGGPPTHIRLLRDLCVERTGWVEPAEFEDAIAACNLLPGPASTQLAIFCGWRVRGRVGAVVGGLAFILPGLLLILALAAVFMAGAPPRWVVAAGAGAGSAVAAVAVHAAVGLVPASWRRAGDGRVGSGRLGWSLCLAVGSATAAAFGPYVVLAILGCGTVAVLRAGGDQRRRLSLPLLPAKALTAATTAGVWGSLTWVAFKVGALSYGGGFVIVPLMQADAVSHHWATPAQFLNAVALGQVTPGPVVLTVAVVGYTAAGVAGALLATCVAFGPSFAFVLLGAHHFDRLRGNRVVRAFLGGAGPAAIGAILGSAVPLARALGEPWQLAVLAGSAVSVFALRRGPVATLLVAAAAGVLLVGLGAPLPR